MGMDGERHFTPGINCVTGWMGPRPNWTDAENLAPTGIRSLDRPACGESLYRLSYPVSQNVKTLGLFTEDKTRGECKCVS